jgi:predicted PurR-regulated permease PerM
MRAVSSILNPFFLALIVYLSAAPAQAWLMKRGVSGWLSLVVVLLSLVLVLASLLLIMAVSASQVAQTLPEYEPRVAELKESLNSWLDDRGIHIDETLALNVYEPDRLLKLAASVISEVGKVVSWSAVFLMILVFMLGYGGDIPPKLLNHLGKDSPIIARGREYARDIGRYVAITASMGFIAAAGDVILLLVIGVDFALFWGTLSFVLSFVPSIGFILSLIPPVLLALLQFGSQEALIVLVGYWLINGTTDQLLKPRVMGQGLNLSALVVTLSLFFWGWVLGPMGAILAVPLTLTVKKLILEVTDDTQWIADVLGSLPAPEHEL